MSNESVIREVLAEHGRIGEQAATIGVDEDLYAAGMTSHASVNVMIGLEDALDVEFTDDLLNRETFATIASVDAALAGLQEA